MTTDIRQFTQGQTDATLFGLVGPWLSDRAVHVDQAAPITSEVGDVWHVCIEGGDPIGFALTRPTPKGAHIRNVYATRAKARDQLLKAVLKMLAPLEVERVYSVGRKDDELWSRNGFTFEPRRGEFGTWQR